MFRERPIPTRRKGTDCVTGATRRGRGRGGFQEVLFVFLYEKTHFKKRFDGTRMILVERWLFWWKVAIVLQKYENKNSTIYLCARSVSALVCIYMHAYGGVLCVFLLAGLPGSVEAKGRN